MTIIIAGIMDTRTGAITDTVTHPKEKTALRLKVRDELNVTHGKGAFVSFELDTALGTNLEYLRKQMQTDDPQAFAALELLHARYRHHRMTTLLEEKKQELTTCQAAYDQCIALFAPNSVAHDFIELELSESLLEMRNDIDKCAASVRQWHTKVQALSQQAPA